MKFSIEWHKECLYNWKKSLERKEQELERKKREAEKMLQSILFYEEQIRKAEKQGKDGFDSELFLKKLRLQREKNENKD